MNAPARRPCKSLAPRPRQCIGQHFAMTEMLVVVVATLAQRFRLRLAPGRAVTPEPSITLRPREGVHMTLRER